MILAKRIVEIAADKQAADILLLDLRETLLPADYFILCSGSSERHLAALNRDIVDSLKQSDRVALLRQEGVPSSGWVLLDYGDVVVHLFSPEVRDFYRLEELWSAALPVLRMQ